MAEKVKAVDQMHYEEALQELEEILETLEGEARGLDETMNLYERGRALVQHCQTLLEQADLKVRQLDRNDEIQDAEE
ncbi:exodeoxyribonuclease VII small subunit [Pelolinea submarina]|uniref:Exodeoxyribonuclease 7 small subunit n=1 Tax=Pelolinea submarina TaxID=913107 RepID=A0A347ZNM1_9CHLR|nr:exodeoxyribonuclease VII small subunit [Pelolinea submarina]REG08505.1 exodeoxyribonuclease VII small subunit [Pelolinea submarina]BBB46902.1 exodeoxyribonuclease VII small subunit [Pelolinea submarina]